MGIWARYGIAANRGWWSLGWVPFLALLLAAGCAHSGSTPTAGALAVRILPPAIETALPLPALPADLKAELGPPLSDDEVNGLESLPPPRTLSAEAPHVIDGVASKPLTLDEAIALAFRYQPRLQVLRERVNEAAGKGEAAFAPFLPQVHLKTRTFAGHNPTTPLDASPLPALEFPTARGYQNFALAELYCNWTLWDFGRTYGRYQQAKLAQDIAQLQSTRQAQFTAFDVAAAYARVLEAQAALRVANESVKLGESVLDISEKSRKVGLVVNDEVLRAQVQLAQARRLVINAERDRKVSIARLNQAIGLNVSAPTQIVDWASDPEFRMSLEECLGKAVGNRREFQIARTAIESASEGERVARADFLPRVEAEGAVGAADGHKALTGFTQGGSIYVSWSPYLGGKRKGELRAASASVRAAIAQAQVVCDNIAMQVNEAYRDLEAARQSIVLARPAVSQARENVRLVTQKYKNGDATPTDIVDAETALTRAEQNLYTARYDYLTALASIDFAMGVTPVPLDGLIRESHHGH